MEEIPKSALPSDPEEAVATTKEKEDSTLPPAPPLVTVPPSDAVNASDPPLDTSSSKRGATSLRILSTGGETSGKVSMLPSSPPVVSSSSSVSTPPVVSSFISTPPTIPTPFSSPSASPLVSHSGKDEWISVDEVWSFNNTLQVYFHKASNAYFQYDLSTKGWIPIKDISSLSKSSYSASKTLISSVRAAVKYMQGRRGKQEDRHIVLENLKHSLEEGDAKAWMDRNYPRISLYGLFDGHSGSLASEFCAQNLPKQILAYLCKGVNTSSSPEGLSEESIKQRISAAFVRTDKEFLLKYRVAKDGCTAVMALVLQNTIFVAGLGDSRAILGCMKGTHIKSHRLMEDHKPNRPDESKRIEENGGFVVKVDGIARVAPSDYEQRVKRIKMETCMQGSSALQPPVLLAVSRAFGDRELKLARILSNIPEITVIHLTEADRFIVMACDGVWDVLSDQEVADLVYANLTDAEEAASVVVRSAFQRQSQDNLTAMTLIFDRPSI
ncbi:protein phosphatase 2C domain-containing protein [Cardiosporidium cionae]|uniref:Protein phosphatase 2C domain-containing protein n=1 Tax=Cardiosporidium cionae TaxID=476202 RepID=A0ABQ7JDK4_9APIC|nr:protein phosphatase 2C domain-containing protein [Cardiosporidium cionae]|eukprot:KAF8822111.1 protein phosphatase 2C domain-containing protein [Cardiosporidium cionae]